MSSFERSDARQVFSRRPAIRGYGPISAALCLASVLAGCAGDAPNVEFTRSAYSCVDDSAECVARRQNLLHQLQSDQSRSWMRESPTPDSYASGVRLFAMQSKKHELSCEELARGRQEAENAHGALHSQGSRYTQAQISRSSMFAADVGRELSKEFGKRCRHS